MYWQPSINTDTGTAVTHGVGCGGDRDKTKRPIMAQAACEHSDKAILTSDNPRTEDPEVILNEMEEGLTPSQKRNTCASQTGKKR